MIIYTKKELEDRELKYNDNIEFSLKGETVRYNIGIGTNRLIYLNYIDKENFYYPCKNNSIFKLLGISNKYKFVQEIVNYVTDTGDFPELKSLEDLKKVCLKLYELVEIHNNKTLKVNDLVTFKIIHPKYLTEEIYILSYVVVFEKGFYCLKNKPCIFEVLDLKPIKFNSLTGLTEFCKDIEEYLAGLNYTFLSCSSIIDFYNVVEECTKPTMIKLYVNGLNKKTMGLIFHFFNQESISYFEKSAQEIIFCIDNLNIDKYKLLVKRLKE